MENPWTLFRKRSLEGHSIVAYFTPNETFIERMNRGNAEMRARLARSVVYFIRCNCSVGFIKIGLADNVPSRLAALQGCCPYKLEVIATMPGGVSAEKEMHKQFSHAREIGEWFRPTPDLLAFIEGLPPP